ncbi:MAG: hypothetical protein IJY62_05855 [Clostridia bacterium]|nr:hypothetical protein [Clostridia bacterium]
MKKFYVTPELESMLFDSDVKTDIVKVSGMVDTTNDGTDTMIGYDWNSEVGA